MALIPIDYLETGMVLKEAVADRSGRLLLPAGAVLTDKQLKIFRTWGIAEANIVRDQDDDSPEGAEHLSCDDPVKRAEAEEYVAELFKHNDQQHPMIQELLMVCRNRRLANG